MKSTQAASGPPVAMTPIALLLETKREEMGLLQPEFVELLSKTARRQFKARGIDLKRLDRFSLEGYRSWLRKREPGVRDGVDEWYWFPVFSEVLDLPLTRLTEIRFSDLLDAKVPELAALRRRQAAGLAKRGRGRSAATDEAVDEMHSSAALREAMSVLAEFRKTNEALEERIESMSEQHAGDIARIIELLGSIGAKKSELTALRAKSSAIQSSRPAASKRS